MKNQAVPELNWSNITCGEGCWSAKEVECKCSCGGKNHGIWLKGGKPEFRTCKLNGIVYKLLAAGNYKDLRPIQAAELNKYGVMRCYDYEGKGNYQHQTYREHYQYRGDKIHNFPLVIKFATLSQCAKWHELSEFKGINSIQRYHLEPALLWEIVEKPEPLKHECGII